MKIDVDLFLAVALGIMFVIALCSLGVTNHALRKSDRYYAEVLRASDRTIRAESAAAKWRALAGTSMFQPRPEDMATEAIPRINERHIVPLSQGGRYTDGT